MQVIQAEVCVRKSRTHAVEEEEEVIMVVVVVVVVVAVMMIEKVMILVR